MKNVLKQMLLSPAITSATDAAIQRKMFGSDITTLIMSNQEIDDIMKIIKSLRDVDLLIKVVSETIKKEAKEQKSRFNGMLLGALCASLSGDLLIGKGVK